MEPKLLEELRQKYIKNPPEGMTASFVKNMLPSPVYPQTHQVLVLFTDPHCRRHAAHVGHLNIQKYYVLCTVIILHKIQSISEFPDAQTDLLFFFILFREDRIRYRCSKSSSTSPIRIIASPPYCLLFVSVYQRFGTKSNRTALRVPECIRGLYRIYANFHCNSPRTNVINHSTISES